MKLARSAFAAALLLAACTPPATTTTSTSTTTSAVTGTTHAASFTVNDLQESDGNIQGCTRSLSRTGAAPSAGEIFREDGVDTGAVGFVRIDGALIAVNLVSSNGNEKGGTRTFADKANTTQIVETLTTGAAHEEADSVEESGSLAITHNGATQTIQVEGGTAC